MNKTKFKKWHIPELLQKLTFTTYVYKNSCIRTFDKLYIKEKNKQLKSNLYNNSYKFSTFFPV